MRDHPPRDLDWNAFPDLGDLVGGRIEGRNSDAQTTLFLNSTGVGAQFTAVAQLIIRTNAGVPSCMRAPAEAGIPMTGMPARDARSNARTTGAQPSL